MAIPQRIKRIEKQILRELSQILTFEIKNPNIKSVVFSKAAVSKDLSFAKIYYFVGNSRKETQDLIDSNLNKMSNVFRSILIKRMKLKRIPNLKFIRDKSLEYSSKIEKILDEEKKIQEQRDENKSKQDN